MENSLFVRLPPELRTAIYEYAFNSPNGVFLHCKRCFAHRRQHKPQQHLLELSRSLALAQTCAQIRRESWSILFDDNTFLLQHYAVCDLEGKFKDTLARLPQEFCQAMRTVHVQLLTPLCFCSEKKDCPSYTGGGWESHVEWKLMKLLNTIKVCTEQMPECSIVFQMRFCYDLDTTVGLRMLAGDQPWDDLANHACNERHRRGIVDSEKQAARQELQERTRRTLLRILSRAMTYSKS